MNVFEDVSEICRPFGYGEVIHAVPRKEMARLPSMLTISLNSHSPQRAITLS